MTAKKVTKSAPPSSTLVLLVRHGQTPTTGKLLPGRAAGLHLAETGIKQAEAAAERFVGLKKLMPFTHHRLNVLVKLLRLSLVLWVFAPRSIRVYLNVSLATGPVPNSANL